MIFLFCRDKEEFIEKTQRLAFFCVMKNGMFSLHTNTKKKFSNYFLTKNKTKFLL